MAFIPHPVIIDEPLLLPRSPLTAPEDWTFKNAAPIMGEPDPAVLFESTKDKNAFVLSKPFGHPVTQLWVSVSLRIEGFADSPCECSIAFLDHTSGKSLCEFVLDSRAIAVYYEKYRYHEASFRRTDRGDAVTPELVRDGLPDGCWENWVIGVEIVDDPFVATQRGMVYSAYFGGRAVAIRVPFRPVSPGLMTLDQVLFQTISGSVWLRKADLYATSPVDALTPYISPTPSEPQPARYDPSLSADFGLELTPHGGFVVHGPLGSEFKVSSRFAVATNVFELNTLDAEPAWEISHAGPLTVEISDANAAPASPEQVDWDIPNEKPLEWYTVRAKAPSFTLERRIFRLPRCLQIRDYLTNTTDDLVGMDFGNWIHVADRWQDSTLCGFFHAPRVVNNTPERPFLHVVNGSGSIGMIARDQIYRNQSRVVGFPGNDGGADFGICDSHLAFAPRSSHTLVWELYPLDSNDYFQFINTVRAAWHTNQTVESYLLAFTSDNVSSFDAHGKSYLGPALSACGARHFLLSINCDTAPARPAYGTDYIEHAAEARKKAQDVTMPAIKAALPDVDLVFLPYIHTAVNPLRSASAPEYETCKAILSDTKKQKLYNPEEPNSELQVGYYVGRSNNAWGKFVYKLLTIEMSDFGSRGAYFDEFSLGETPIYLSIDSLPWDGASMRVDLPENPGQPSRVSNYSLITAAFRTLLCHQLRRNSQRIWANWFPTTQQDTALGIPCFVERADLENCSRAHLTSPLAYAGVSQGNTVLAGFEIVADVVHFVNRGLLPGFVALIARMCFRDGEYVEGERFFSALFPITPRELHPGVVFADERIVTVRSGDYGFGDATPLKATVFGIDGLVRAVSLHETKIGGGEFPQNITRAHIDLVPGELAVITRQGD